MENEKTELLMAWIEENFMVTLDAMPANIVEELLHIAVSDQHNFAALAAKGLAFRLKHTAGNSTVVANGLKAYLTECKIKLAMTSLIASGVPAVPLFSMSFLDPEQHRQLKEVDKLLYGSNIHVAKKHCLGGHA